MVYYLWLNTGTANRIETVSFSELGGIGRKGHYVSEKLNFSKNSKEPPFELHVSLVHPQF